MLVSLQAQARGDWGVEGRAKTIYSVVEESQKGLNGLRSDRSPTFRPGLLLIEFDTKCIYHQLRDDMISCIAPVSYKTKDCGQAERRETFTICGLVWRTIRGRRTKPSPPIYLRKKIIILRVLRSGIITITTTTTNVRYNVCRINIIQSSCSVESCRQCRCSSLAACWGRFHVGTLDGGQHKKSWTPRLLAKISDKTLYTDLGPPSESRARACPGLLVLTSVLH